MPTIEVPKDEGVTLTVDGKPVVTVTRPEGSEAAPTVEAPTTPPPENPPKPPEPPTKPEPPLQEMPL